MEFEGKIAPYLIQYYKMDHTTKYVIEEMDPKELLITERIDLGAKLYYVDSVVTGENRALARELYGKHIEAFSDGILDRAKRVANSGIEWYFEKFERLISVFQNETYDMDQEYVPVDKNGVLMDGAHRTVCGIYFGKKIKVIRFLDIQYQCHDMWYFRKRGLEEGYLQLMAYTFTCYKEGAFIEKFERHLKKDRLLNIMKNKQCDLLYMQYVGTGEKASTECIVYHESMKSGKDEQQKLRTLLKIQEKELQQGITVSTKEMKRYRRIRFVRNRYKRVVLFIKKVLGKT